MRVVLLSPSFDRVVFYRFSRSDEIEPHLLAGMVIDCRQRAESTAIVKSTRDEVHAPRLIPAGRLWTGRALGYGTAKPRFYLSIWIGLVQAGQWLTTGLLCR